MRLATQEEFRKWYYMDCAAMSFDPYNLAFDPYSKLRVFIKKDQTGGAYAIDYPTHNEGRGIVYPDFGKQSERCVVETAGHAACVYARDGTLRAVDAQTRKIYHGRCAGL